jgi:biotin carboxyl carrier protein
MGVGRLANLMTGRELLWKWLGREIAVSVTEAGGQGMLRLANQTVAFAANERDAAGGWLEIDGRRQRFYVHRNRDGVAVWIGGRTYHLTRLQKGVVADTGSAASSGEIRALMPGKILRIPVSAGDAVEEKQPLVVMESMKMETTLAAPRAGRVSALKCSVGQVVEMGELLVIVE